MVHVTLFEVALRSMQRASRLQGSPLSTSVAFICRTDVVGVATPLEQELAAHNEEIAALRRAVLIP